MKINNSIFLNWLADRLVCVYKESENVDFVIKLRSIATEISLEKYDRDCEEDFISSLIEEGLIEPCKKEKHTKTCRMNAELEIHNKLLELKSLKNKH